MHVRGIAFFLAFICLIFGCSPNKTMLKSAGAANTYRFVKEAGGIREYELVRNGLRILLDDDPSASVSAFMVTYLAGPRDEIHGLTGAAHLVEHMMFKGSAKYQKEHDTSIHTLLQRRGALLNATTGPDTTAYYEVLAAEHLGLAIEIEADRMRQALLREEDFVPERSVVMSELELDENSPKEALLNAVWAAAHPAHPYHHPLIGWREDVKAMPVGELKRFYDTYYWPNNAVVSVIGDFNPDQVLAEIDRLFGAIPRSPQPIPFPETTEPPQRKKQVVTVEKEGAAESLIIAYRSPAGTDPDAFRLYLASHILANGRTSRFYQKLIESGLATEVHSEVTLRRDPGLFVTQISLNTGAAHSEAEEAALEILDEFRRNGPTEAEMMKAKNQLKTETAFAKDGPFQIALGLNSAIAAGDWSLFPNFFDTINRISTEEVKQAAAQYLTHERMTVGYLKALAVPGTDGDIGTKRTGNTLGRLDTHSTSYLSPRYPVPPTRSTYMSPEIKVISLKTQVKDAVTVAGSFDGAGRLYSQNPVLAPLVIWMLEKQTRGYHKFEISEVLESHGAEVAFRENGRRIQFELRCLKQDLPLVLSLVAKQLRFPAFDPAEFEQTKKMAGSSIREAMTDTSAQCAHSLARLLFPPTHPNHEAAFEDQLAWLEKTTAQDLKTFHDAHYGPNQMIVIAVGDVDPETVKTAVQESFSGWESKKVPQIRTDPVETGVGIHQLVPVPGKTNVSVFMGHAIPVHRLSPDYLAVYTANAALGGNFSARLTKRVRAERGLTYSIYSNLVGMGKDWEGGFQIMMTLAPDRLREGLQATIRELETFTREGIAAGELEDAKNAIIGNFKIALSTTKGVADRIRAFEEDGRGADYLGRYPALIQAVTKNDVNKAIRRYWRPDRLKVVVSGTLSDEEFNRAIQSGRQAEAPK